MSTKTKPMKTFTRHLHYDEIKKACEDAGFYFFDTKYKQGGDHVTFVFRHMRTFVDVCYSTVNGKAFGNVTRKGRKPFWFSTSSAEHESAQWFKALLKFIYK